MLGSIALVVACQNVLDKLSDGDSDENDRAGKDSTQGHFAAGETRGEKPGQGSSTNIELTSSVGHSSPRKQEYLNVLQQTTSNFETGVVQHAVGCLQRRVLKICDKQHPRANRSGVRGAGRRKLMSLDVE